MLGEWKRIFFWFYCSLGIVTACASISMASEKRMKTIDFEDELVEAMNKRNLDSLSYLGEKEKDRKNRHLYRKRVGFRGETTQLLHEMRYQ